MNSLAPFGVLDSESTNVSGWALDNRGVARVVARVDESAELPLTYGASRPDVALAWPGYPGAAAVGFTGTLDLASLGDGSGCPHLVEIVVTDTDGNERTIDRALVAE